MTDTLAERLGFSSTDRVAVVHCDDIGVCHAANVGALEALTAGPATGGSVMVPYHLTGHPARDGEELSAISGDAHMRDFERRFYGGDEGRAAFTEAGVRTVGMRELRALMRDGAAARVAGAQAAG